MVTTYFTGYTPEELSVLIAERIKEHLQIENPEIEAKDNKYLTREEVAALCKVKSLSTLWNWKKNGLLLPKAKAGRKPLYLKSEVINFLEQKKGGSDVS